MFQIEDDPIKHLHGVFSHNVNYLYNWSVMEKASPLFRKGAGYHLAWHGTQKLCLGNAELLIKAALLHKEAHSIPENWSTRCFLLVDRIYAVL
jgi:hypothetical protein